MVIRPLDIAFIAVLLVLVAVTVFLLRSRRRDRARIQELDHIALRRADQVAAHSHEIRTPLAVIRGAAELLAEQSAGQLTQRQQTFVRRIIDNAMRMHALSEQLLTRARIEAGLFEVSPVQVDVRRLLREVIEDLSQVFSATTIVLDSPGAPIVAWFDPEMVRQVVSNLVTNAIRSHAPPLGDGTGQVEVRVIRGDEEVIIAVSDGGSGMSDEQRDRLFSRFTSGQPLGNGTGIGLYVSQQLVDLHRGRMYVDTITGKGTTVMFTLPLDVRRG